MLLEFLKQVDKGNFGKQKYDFRFKKIRMSLWRRMNLKFKYLKKNT